MVIKKNIKNFVWENYWAESICRTRRGNKEYLFAYVRVKHSYDDIEMNGEGMWVGMTPTPVYEMEIDKDQDSDTYRERVAVEIPTTYADGRVEMTKVTKGSRYAFEFEATKANVEKFKKLYDTTMHGTTELLWIVNTRPYTCHYPDDFWDSDLKSVQSHILKQRSIKIGKD